MIDIMENKVIGPAILKGEAKIVTGLLEEQFGTVPDWVTEKLGSAKEAELMAWSKRILRARTLNDVFES
jgi:hypothetical protein